MTTEMIASRCVSTATLTRQLAPYWYRYTADDTQAAMACLRVWLEIDGMMAGYDNLTLDGLLAAMVVQEAYGGVPIDGTHSPYLLPVPLKLLWRHPESALPLWACNHFKPVGDNTKTSTFLHKRTVRPEHVRSQKGQKTPYGIKGPYKEKRVPLPAQTARYWYADCVGEYEEVRRLLSMVEVVGKRRMGLVRRIAIEVVDQFELRRPVPLLYYGDNVQVYGHQYVGWSPPYWPRVPECQGECVMIHTKDAYETGEQEEV